MWELFKTAFLSSIGRDTIVVFTATAVNALLGGIFFIIAPRILGPLDYGLFSVVLVTAILATNIANFGIDSGILRFSSHNNLEKTKRVLKLAFISYTLLGFTTFLLSFLLSTPLAKFLGQPILSPLLKVASAGVILLLLTNFFIAVLQSRKRFLASSIVQISSNLARLIVLLFAAYFFTINLPFMTVLFFAINIISVIIGKIFVPLEFLKSSEFKKEFAGFFGYNFWVAASIMVASIPVGNYLLIKLAGPFAAGIFAAPVKLFTAVDQLAGNLSRVLASRLSSLEDDASSLKIAKEFLPAVLVVSTIIFFSAVFAAPITKILLGEKYLQSIAVFRIIAIGEILVFASVIPESLILYYFGKSNIIFVITLSTFIFWFIANLVLIPKFQAQGAAYANLLYVSSAFLLYSLYALWKFKRTR